MRKTAGNLVISVLDPHKAAVVGAELKLINSSNGKSYTARMEQPGEYHFESLPPASYTLEIKAKGFRTAQVQGVRIADGNASREVVLAVGRADQTVFVSAGLTDFSTIKLADPTTESTVDKTVTNLLLNEAQTGSYKSLEMLPSVNDQSGDAYGLALGKTLRLRGAFQSDEFLRNIDGLPVSDHGGGGDFIDFENVAQVNLYRGAIPAAQSFGVRNITGGMDLSVLWPRDHAGITFKESAGGENFRRTFFRLDSGRLPSGTAAFLSFSSTTADKWRGSGGQPKDRYNVELSLSQKIGSHVQVNLLGVHHELKQHDFRALNYTQATNLGTYYYYDYNASLSGVGSNDINYYDYTRQSYKDTLLMADVVVDLAQNGKLTVKPYYWKDKGYRLIGGATSGNYGYRYMKTQPENYGVTSQYEFSPLKHVNLALGYWYQSESDSLPPPLAQKFYKFQDSTDTTATFLSWLSLEKVSNRTYHTPYVSGDVTLGKTTISASLKYVYQDDPSMTFYKTTGLGDITYEAALQSNPTVDYGVSKRIWRSWEPTFAVNQALTNRLTAYFSYGEGYQRSTWSGQASAYTSNRTKFTAAGITFDDLWNSLKPEKVKHFDAGVRYKDRLFTVAPTFYYMIENNKAVTVYDANVAASYLQSNEDAHVYGVELEATARVPQVSKGDLQFYLSTSYNDLTFDHNIQNASSNTVLSNGKQMADTPRNMVKLGATYALAGVSVTPVVRFIGERYGDIENKQRISSYAVADLNAKYTPRSGAFRDMTFSFSATNLLNKRYIGVINTSDFTLSSSTTYYPGAPRTVMGGIFVQVDQFVKGLKK